MLNPHNPLVLGSRVYRMGLRIREHWFVQKILVLTVLGGAAYYTDHDWRSGSHTSPRFWFSLAMVIAIFVIIVGILDADQTEA